jgi:hypothetical protein
MPRRSLHCSAASLAVECFQLREAERLIGRALAGNPPSDNKNELDRYKEYADPLNHKRLDLICVVGAGCWVFKRLDNDDNQWEFFQADDDFNEIIAFCSILSSSLVSIYRDRENPPLNRYFGI